MKISILLITYNQEQYIRQCLDSIIMQQTGVETEVIVADDCSTDQTISIIREYAVGSSFSFLFLPGETNLGFVKNYQRAFAACSGDYIAVMEGDDYWTDPQRLAKHLDFLEKHRECVMTMNRYVTFNQLTHNWSTSAWSSPESYTYVTTREMALANKLGNLSACVFRKAEVHKMKPDLFDLVISDWMIGMVLGQYGFIAILKDMMSVYRVHSSGQWSKMTKHEQAQKMISTIDSYNAYLEYKYDNEFGIHKRKLGELLPSNAGKYAVSDFFPPVIMHIVKLLVPRVVVNLVKRR